MAKLPDDTWDEVQGPTPGFAEQITTAITRVADTAPAASDPAAEWEEILRRGRARRGEPEPAAPDPIAEWEAIRGRRRARAGQAEPEAPDEAVGTSPLAQELEQSGYLRRHRVAAMPLRQPILSASFGTTYPTWS